MPEFRMHIMTLHFAEHHGAAQVAEAAAAVARQKQLIMELERSGRSTKGSLIMLSLLEDDLQNAEYVLAMTKFKSEAPFSAIK